MHNVTGPNATVTVTGIKCDNISCSFVDMSVKVEDYDLWLNRPCPNCGENLLTQSDYNRVKFQLNMAEMLNRIFIPKDKNKKRARMQLRHGKSNVQTDAAAVDEQQ